MRALRLVFRQVFASHLILVEHFMEGRLFLVEKNNAAVSFHVSG